MQNKKSGKMFFEPLFLYDTKEPLALSNKSPIRSNGNGYADEYLKRIVSELPEDGEVLGINLINGYPEHIKANIGKVFREDDEGYAIAISGNTSEMDGSIDIYATGKRGFIYAVSTLYQLINRGLSSDLLLFDAPQKKIRGYRVFTPGINQIDDFKKMVDLLVYYKYNAIMMEVGGAMEYERHPEINESWVKFCNMLFEAGPDEADKIQNRTFPWEKNCFHSENGEGGFISKKLLREVVDYCRERGIEVIPEVPSLSHCDYLVMAHPEIAERAEDPYPDTYCPSNPKSYELIFDVFDEILEVFEPKYVNIGHDELYSVAVCPNCKGKDPVDLYVGDITKINDYLKARGCRSIMWSEKAYELVLEHPYGGAEWKEKGIPKMTGCIGKIPKDVILLNWYWSYMPEEKDREILQHGYTMWYGNFTGSVLKDYQARMSYVEGAFVSNWGSVEDEYMQRNSQKTMLADTAYAFWNPDYSEEKFPILYEKTRTELYEQYKRNVVGREDIIEITHTTDFDKDHVLFYCGLFLVPEEWRMGHHIVRYTDGTEIKLPVIFRYNIGNSAMDVNSREMRKFFGASFPFEEDGRTYYKTAYKNPHPEKTISGIHFEAEMPEVSVEIKL